VAGPSAEFLRRLAGQHLTSVGASVTPVVLPVLVVLRLGVTPNAYFYVTEMLGGVFFMISPSVSVAVFAEGVRTGADLRAVVVKALRVIAVLLAPAIVVMVAGGRLILGLFGASYAAAGYGILVMTLAGAWVLMPPLGIAGVGVAWLGAQTLGRWPACLPTRTSASR
jgi:hypothetical protein